MGSKMITPVTSALFKTRYQKAPLTPSDGTAIATGFLDNRPALQVQYTYPNDLVQTNILMALPQQVVQNNNGHPIISQDNFTEEQFDAAVYSNPFVGMRVDKDIQGS